MNSRFTQQKYKEIYLTGSNARKFYGTAKVWKPLELGTIEQWPLRPLVSNVGAASYHLAKYFAKNVISFDEKRIHSL